MVQIRDIDVYKGSYEFHGELTNEIFAHWESQCDRAIIPFQKQIIHYPMYLLYFFKISKFGWGSKEIGKFGKIGSIVGAIIGMALGFTPFHVYIDILGLSIFMAIVGLVIGIITLGPYGSGIPQFQGFLHEKESKKPKLISKKELKERKQKFLSDKIYRVKATAEYFQQTEIKACQKLVSDLKSKIDQQINLSQNTIKDDLSKLRQVRNSGKFDGNREYIKHLDDGIAAAQLLLDTPSEKFLELQATREAQELELRKMETITRTMLSFVDTENSFSEYSAIADKYLSTEPEFESMNADAKLNEFITEFQEIGSRIRTKVDSAIEMVNSAKELPPGPTPTMNLLGERLKFNTM